MVKVLLIFILVAILMEDGSSIRKTKEEIQEEEEVAKAVNRTLAEEEEKRKREEEDGKKRQDHQEKEKKLDQEKGKKEKKEDKLEKQERQDEACLPVNVTCPIVDPCQPCKVCEECPEVVECGPCPTIRCEPCKPCVPGNTTTVDPPSGCPDPASMSVPVALAVGAMASLLVTGMAAAIGLLLRYVSPFVSGFLFISLVAITWYLSSHYPETARDLGGRVVATLREATVALGHRVVEAIQRHNDQVGFPV
jgi:uncharacterized membrane protein YphA (DoxX/SURF4 family)